MTGRGLGPAVIREFGTNYIFTNRDVGAIVADPSTRNKRSLSAFRKAGFNVVDTVQLVDEAFERHIVRLDRGELEIVSRSNAVAFRKSWFLPGRRPFSACSQDL